MVDTKGHLAVNATWRRVARDVRVAVAASVLAGWLGLGSLTPVLIGQSRGTAATTSSSGRTWVTAWGTSQQALGQSVVTNATVRMIAGSNRGITFGGQSGATVPPGESVWSDPVPLPVLAQQDVAISLFIPGTEVRPSQHTNAVVTSYVTADGSGDRTLDEERTPFTKTTTASWWVKAIDVETMASSKAIVLFGDSITDGTCSTLDAHDRWGNHLAVRLALADDADRSAGRRPPLRAVINEGIGGNTVTREGLTPPPDSPPGLERLQRDVLSHHGVSDVVVFMGTNDIRRGAASGRLIAGLAEMSKTLSAAGIRTTGVTMIPRHNVAPTPANSGWNDAKTQVRRELNQWIRSRGSFDRLIDFDQVVRDPDHQDLMQARFNCGDGIHPSPAGYFAMGGAIDLSPFRR
jgi:lysophospholipase L1-like esterase